MKKQRSTRPRPHPSSPSSRPKSTKPPDPTRCQFLSSVGRQCRMPRSSRHRTLCANHAKREEDRHAQSLAAKQVARELASLSGDFKTASDVNHVLGKVLSLLAQGRIPRRDAIAFAYISQLLLQSLPKVQKEIKEALGFDAWQETLASALGSESDEVEDDAAEEEDESDGEISEPVARVFPAALAGRPEALSCPSHGPSSCDVIAQVVPAALHPQDSNLDPDDTPDPDENLSPDRLRAIAAAAFAKVLTAAARDESLDKRAMRPAAQTNAPISQRTQTPPSSAAQAVAKAPSSASKSP
jgi:hypothetical protein